VIAVKISLNDKRVFIILGILGIAVIYRNFIYTGQKKEIKKYTQIIEAYNEQSADYEGLATFVSGIDTELKIFNEKIKNIRKLFPPEIMQNDVLMLMNKFSLESGLNIKTISFKEVDEVKQTNISKGTTSTNVTSVADSKIDSTENVGDSTDKTANTVIPTKTVKTNKEIMNEKFLNALEALGIAYGKKTEGESYNENVKDGRAYSLGISINGTSNNQQLKDFLYRVENFTNVTSINNIQINSEGNGLLSVNMEIEFYGIADRKAASQEYYFDVEWTPLKAAGKTDMFKPFEGYIELNNQLAKEEDNEQKNASKSMDYDFSLSIMPYGNNMSPPTVSFLGKSVVGNDGQIPIVYGDSRENEKVNLYLEAVNDKFYCKFKTDHEVFPDEQYKSLARFEPIGDDIRMVIVSSRRTSTNDKAGVAITVTNKTGKNLIIDVVDDDSKRPRVSIVKEDNVLVNYK